MQHGNPEQTEVDRCTSKFLCSNKYSDFYALIYVFIRKHLIEKLLCKDIRNKDACVGLPLPSITAKAWLYWPETNMANYVDFLKRLTAAF
jgi:hypothetical protein